MCTQRHARHGSGSVVLLTREMLRYRVSIRTFRRNTTEGSFTIPAHGTHKSNAQSTNRLSFSERSRSRRSSCFHSRWWRNERWRESIHGLIKLFFHNLGQHLCLLLQFHCPLLLLSLLFPLLTMRIMLLQQFLRFLDLLLFLPTLPPRRAGGRK